MKNYGITLIGVNYASLGLQKLFEFLVDLSRFFWFFFFLVADCAHPVFQVH